MEERQPDRSEEDERPGAPNGRCWLSIGVWGREEPRCPELARVVHCHNCEVFQTAAHDMFDREPPEGYGAEWVQAVADPAVPDAGRAGRCLVFGLGGELFALPVTSVVEVLAWRTIRRVPHVRDAAVAGLANVRGELRLCVSLDVLFGAERPAPPEASPGRRLIAIGTNEIEWLVPVEATLGTPRVAPDALAEAPVTVFRSPVAFVRGLFDYHDRRVGLLDADLLLGTLRRRIG
jgi:chemotaxis-related protein WspD